MAFKAQLQLARGTKDIYNKLVQRFPPALILAAYRNARSKAGTGDIVLLIQDDGEIMGYTREAYAAKLRPALGGRLAEFGDATGMIKSAHAVANLPAEEDAMWLVFEIPGCVISTNCCVAFAVSYEVANTGENLVLS